MQTKKEYECKTKKKVYIKPKKMCTTKNKEYVRQTKKYQNKTKKTNVTFMPPIKIL
jgi:hypothetical protein